MAPQDAAYHKSYRVDVCSVGMEAKNLKNIHSEKKMPQRWLATTLLSAEKKFRRVKGYLAIAETRKNIVQMKEMGDIVAA